MAGDGSARFSPTMRLKKKTEFIRVFRKGEAWKGSRFSLHILPRTGDILPRGGDILPRTGDILPRTGDILPRTGDILPRGGDVLPRVTDRARSQDLSPRLGMVVTRKVGPAVERNRIKRKIREAFRKTAHRLPAVDLVIKPNATCKEAPEDEIMRTLERAVNKVLGNVKEEK
ncbi:ribonuclease P protein component [Candidatus Bipolaricaulota bacterium]